VPDAWQLVHWVLEVIVPVCQFGVACPPWQLTLVHRSSEEQSNAGVVAGRTTVFALYVVSNATLAGEDLGGRVWL